MGKRCQTTVAVSVLFILRYKYKVSLSSSLLSFPNEDEAAVAVLHHSSRLLSAPTLRNIVQRALHL